MKLAIDLVELDEIRFDCERSNVRHCVAGVHRQIEEHLLDLTAVGSDVAHIASCYDPQLDVLPDTPRQQVVHVRYDGVEVKHFRLGDVPASEDEQLPGELHRAFGSALDVLNVRKNRRPIVDFFSHECGVVQNNCQQIVKVVGNPSGELAKALKALRLAESALESTQLGICTLAFGDIKDHHNDAYHLTIGHNRVAAREPMVNLARFCPYFSRDFDVDNGFAGLQYASTDRLELRPDLRNHLSHLQSDLIV